MARRIDEQIIRGEIDNRVRGRVTGRLWLFGRAEPVELDLEGDPWRDVAGHLFTFTNPAPRAGRPGALDGLSPVQRGRVGDMTASRRVKVPDCSPEELKALLAAGRPFPWRWGNCLYLEWHGDADGRVVIESASYRIEIAPDPAWTMTDGEERSRRAANQRSALDSLERMASSGALAGEEDDAPASDAEAAADAEQARIDLLIDRVEARIARAIDAGEEPDFERIMEEERARLRRERGEPEPEPPASEEAAEQAEWIQEMNAAAENALRDGETDRWKSEGYADDRWHPLVQRCHAFTLRVRADVRARGWLGDGEGPEHPLRMVLNGVMIAGGKLAGALGRVCDASDWPPDALFAGSALTRLKKAREHLRDALAGLDAADEQDLADADWRREARGETAEILDEVVRLIGEVRAVLRLPDGEA